MSNRHFIQVTHFNSIILFYFQHVIKHYCREHFQQIQGGLHLVCEEGCPGPEESFPCRDVPFTLEAVCDADTNKDGLVSKASFSKLIDAAATLPRAYGYAPADSDLYKTEAEKDAARQKMFDSMDLKSTGVITFDEWLKFCREHIAAKTTTMDPHPIIDQGSVEEYKKFIKAAIDNSSSAEALELYWYMLEIFTEQDGDKDGIVKLAEFPSMMNQV